MQKIDSKEGRNLGSVVHILDLSLTGLIVLIAQRGVDDNNARGVCVAVTP